MERGTIHLGSREQLFLNLFRPEVCAYCASDLNVPQRVMS